MRRIFFLSCLWACAPVFMTHRAAADAPAQFAIELSDGSRVIGTPGIDRLKITTRYASMDVELSLVRGIEFKGKDRTAQVSLQNGDLVSGQLALSEITVKTGFGPAVIHMTDVRRIRAARIDTGKPLPDGCVLHYTFRDDEGGNIEDASGSGNAGTATNGASYVTDGKSGGAMSFNGRGQAVMVKSAGNLKMQDFTIMAWIRRGSTKRVCIGWAQAMIFGYGDGGYNMGIDEDGSLVLAKVNLNEVDSTCRITDDSFHHMAVTKHGNKIVFYLDGVAYPAQDYDANFEFKTDLAAGGRPDNSDACFLGLVDELAVFNRPLSADEVKGVYESQK